ncbi:unnamed protein product, partial [Choristocarpus tenellus]
SKDETLGTSKDNAKGVCISPTSEDKIFCYEPNPERTENSTHPSSCMPSPTTDISSSTSSSPLVLPQQAPFRPNNPQTLYWGSAQRTLRSTRETNAEREEGTAGISSTSRDPILSVRAPNNPTQQLASLHPKATPSASTSSHTVTINSTNRTFPMGQASQIDPWPTRTPVLKHQWKSSTPHCLQQDPTSLRPTAVA